MQHCFDPPTQSTIYTSLACVVLVSCPRHCAIFSILYSRQCFNWSNVFSSRLCWSIHLVNLNHVSFQPSISKCPHSLSLIVKQTDSIVLATFSNSKMLQHVIQAVLYFLFSVVFVLYGNNTILFSPTQML